MPEHNEIRGLRFQVPRLYLPSEGSLANRSLHWGSHPEPAGCKGGQSTSHCKCPAAFSSVRAHICGLRQWVRCGHDSRSSLWWRLPPPPASLWLPRPFQPRSASCRRFWPARPRHAYSGLWRIERMHAPKGITSPCPHALLVLTAQAVSKATLVELTGHKQRWPDFTEHTTTSGGAAFTGNFTTALRFIGRWQKDC